MAERPKCKLSGKKPDMPWGKAPFAKAPTEKEKAEQEPLL